MTNTRKTQSSLRRRFKTVYTLLLVFVLVVAGQLVNLQISKGEEHARSASSSATKTIAISGGRGSILDRNNIPLAYDQEVYNITFYRERGNSSASYSEMYTKSILAAIEIIEGEGGRVIDDFSAKMDENGDWYLDFGTDDPEVFARRETQWRENFYITNLDEYPVSAIFSRLCERYFVPEELPRETKAKVLAVWQLMQMNAFLGNPVVIAGDVSFETVAKISSILAENPGIDISIDNERLYPMDDIAAHVIGYMGKMQSSETIEAYRAKGYLASDSIGITGIERTMEDHLSGNTAFRKGQRVVETNIYGRTTREISYIAPQDGDSVVLTIDLELQKALEDALLKNINATYEIQMQDYLADQEGYDELVRQRGGSELQLAKTGAAIVMEVNSGDVLALASYPSFSLNLFEGGISNEDYALLAGDARAPLFNKAISSRETPGSIFKMVSALAGLEEGVITPTEMIDDESPYSKYDPINGPRCWTRYPHQHSNQTVLEAIKNSCNYFFYETADRLGIEKLSVWTSRMGLTTRTNIELPGESTGVIGGQQTLYDNAKPVDGQSVEKAALVARSIKNLLISVGEDLDRTYEDERLDRVVKSLMDLVNEYSQSESLEHIRNILLNDMGLTSQDVSSRYMVNNIANYLRDIRWTPTQTLMTGIGQAITQVTPVAVARYISAIANGGTVYDAHVVERIISPGGEIVTQIEPTVVGDLPGAQDSLEIIRNGMKGVTSQEDGGTAWKYFSSYKYKDDIGTKTGTAQVSKIDLENHSWFVAFAPFDKPEIAVVVFIPNGYSGAYSYIVIQDAIQYYLDKKAAGADEGIYQPGGLVP
ncbi:MAG: penicillin-binding transpeptidase domain-containing protein [Christensenellales bacterium]|jgi:penicillin-binding protein 2